MLLLCAWCGAEIGRHEEVKTPDVSHGICLPCMFKQSPILTVDYWIRKHPEDAPVFSLALLAGAFVCWWLAYEALPCAGDDAGCIDSGVPQER
jgi:hypothetical protein